MRNRRVQAREAADLLGCSPRLVQKLCQDGTLPGVKVGSRWTITTAQIDAYLNRPMPQPWTPSPALSPAAGGRAIPGTPEPAYASRYAQLIGAPVNSSTTGHRARSKASRT